MLYIKLENNLEEINSKVNFFKRKLYEIKNKFCGFKIEKFENIVLVIIPNTEKYTLNKLSNYIKIKCIGRVCLSQNLMNNKAFIEFIKTENVRVFDGRWLFEFLIKECIEYISLAKKEKLQYQEISFLINKVNKNIVYNIFEIAPKVKTLNIITPNMEQFKKIEKRLYEENGIILNIINNYNKSLLKSDMIFNFDFSEEEINKYDFPRKSVIINLCDKINIHTKAFEGINSHFYEIQLPNKYLKNILLKDFLPEVLYESYIYKKTCPENIKKELEFDKININFLVGKSGRIRKNEYIKLSKKIAN